LDVEWIENRDELLVRAVRGSVEAGYLARGDSVMIVSGSTLEAPGGTSALEILSVEDILEHAKA
jgi:pyruvate kinase